MTALTHLIEDGGTINNAYHRQALLTAQDAVSLDGLPRIADIEGLIEGSLLRRPYFAVVAEGVRPPDSKVLATRKVAGTQVPGFMEGAGVHRQLADGATLKLSQVEDWHRGIRDINDDLNKAFPAESKAYLFYTPAGKRGALPHRDAARVIAIQIEGAKEWHLYDTAPEVGRQGGLHSDTSRYKSVLMSPGDVLYLPHGHAHAATATDQASLHLTFTLMEPTPAALAQAYIAEWFTSGRSATAPGQVFGSPALMAKSLLDDLVSFGETASSGTLTERALRAARTRDESR